MLQNLSGFRVIQSLLLLAGILLLFHKNSFSQSKKEDILTYDKQKLEVWIAAFDSSIYMEKGWGGYIEQAKLNIYRVKNSVDRYFSNGEKNPRFIPKLEKIGQDYTGEEERGAYFYLEYNKEYVIEIYQPSYYSWRITVRTFVPGKAKDYPHFYGITARMQPYKKGKVGEPSANIERIASYSKKEKRFTVQEKDGFIKEFDAPNTAASKEKKKKPDAEQKPATNIHESDGIVAIHPGASAYRRGKDTVNLIDIEDLKQGKWIHFGKENENKAYKPGSKYFEGFYENNQRTGDWIKYSPDSDTTAVLNFDKNNFTGNFKFYHPNGSLHEEGVWSFLSNGLSGKYKEFYDNKTLHKEYQYDSTGTRNGTQFIFHTNENTAIIASMEKDKLHGYVNYYMEDGQMYLQQLYDKGGLVSEKYFGDKDKFPYSLKVAFQELLEPGNSEVEQNLRKTLSELSHLDINYKGLLSQREEELKAANMLLSKQEKELLLAEKKLSRVELENRLKEEEIAKQRWIMAISITGLAIVMVLLFFILRANLQRKKAFALLHKQKEEIHLQKRQIEAKNKDITDSIKYASRIQQAMLTSKVYIDKYLREYFIYFKPRDIVSGDFYWAINQHGKFYIAACDCTGHGVPGAFMSLLNISFLNEIVLEKVFSQPHHILNEVRKSVIRSLNPEGKAEFTKDGMDATVISIDFVSMTVEAACANNPIWIVQQTPSPVLSFSSQNILNVKHNSPGAAAPATISATVNEKKITLTEIKPDKQSVGYSENITPFTNHRIKLKKGDCIYIFTDGYVDQFGGPKGKKFKHKAFKDLLISINGRPMSKQKEIIETTFTKWKGRNEQVDDVCVIGIRV
jgi:serine phosphatase RsbU (regulator of sigma subunit)/antitoxin component YwqK of YwqJK toxin-antitoxin module